MTNLPTPEAALLRDKLAKLLITLKRNREQVPIAVLKTKYQKGYSALCKDISQTAENYARQITLNGIRIDKAYVTEAAAIINQDIQESGTLKELSKAAFQHQDMEAFDSHLEKLHQTIENGLTTFYESHLALYITRECLENPDTLPLIYCLANHCVFIRDTWVPVEEIKKDTPVTQNT